MPELSAAQREALKVLYEAWPNWVRLPPVGAGAYIELAQRDHVCGCVITFVPPSAGVPDA